jgi:hypothetical protein
LRTPRRPPPSSTPLSHGWTGALSRRA